RFARKHKSKKTGSKKKPVAYHSSYLPLPYGDAVPGIGAEGRSGQTFCIVDIDIIRIICPAITDGNRLSNLLGIDKNFISILIGACPMQNLVLACYGKAFDIAILVLDLQPASKIVKCYSNFILLHFHALVGRPAVHYIHSISYFFGGSRQSFTYSPLVARVDI